MTAFRDALADHLAAIRSRDADRLAATLPPDGRVALVTSDGRLVTTAAEFLRRHRDWFAIPTWALDFDDVAAVEGADVAVVVFRLTYRDDPPAAPPVRERSALTLTFRRPPDGRWVMAHDHNTPTRGSP